jgi:hypothetical protein
VAFSLRLSLFRSVDAKPVLASLARFYSGRRYVFLRGGGGAARFELHERDRDWVALRQGAQWDLGLTREANAFTSRDLGCAVLFVFAHEGETWGYDLFRAGEAVDRFMQDPDQAQIWFPADPAPGDPAHVAALVPGLVPEGVAPYLVRRPASWEHPDPKEYFAELRRRNAPARAGDEFPRFHEMAVLDFLRLLGVRVERRGAEANVGAPLFRSFSLGTDRPAP